MRVCKFEVEDQHSCATDRGKENSYTVIVHEMVILLGRQPDYAIGG